MDFISRMFTGLFNRKSQQYKQRATSRVRANTIGKVQGKLLSAQNKLDQKVNRAQDSALKGKFKGDGKGKGKGNAKGGGGPAAVGGGGGGGPSGGRGGAPVPIATRQAQAAGPRPSAAQRASGAAPIAGGVPQRNGNVMGKGKQNKNQAPMGQMAACQSCGNPIQPDWDVCPYCGMAQGQMAAAHGGYGPPQPVAAPPDESERTMAVDLSALQKKGGNRPVVGWIVAQNGNHRGQDFRLYDGKNVLGTAADCDIVITDPYLSAKHCTIRHEDGNFVLIDLDSTNGTFVNQKRVSKMELIDNDTVRFGRTEFKFKALF